MNESNLTKTIMLAVGKLKNTKIFRNNTGMAWIGQRIPCKGGDILLKEPRPLHAGLCVGSSDLIGWTKVKITPEMVGTSIAVFTAIEVKTKSGKITSEQLNFLREVRDSGGISGIARDTETAKEMIENFKPATND